MEKLHMVVLMLMSLTCGHSSFACDTNSCSENTYLAGFAKADISPKAGVDKVPTLTTAAKLVDVVHDPLFAKAAVISDGEHTVAFLSLDLCFLMADAMQELQAHIEGSLKFDHVVVTVTHTHSGMFNHQKLPTLKEKSIDVLARAQAELQAVQIAATSVQVDEAYNRRIHKGNSVEMFWKNPQRIKNRKVDNSLGLIHIQTLKGEPLISLANYSAHPTVTMDLENVVVSADYPGAIASTIREKLGGNVLFLPGAGGDVNPYDSDTKPLALALKKSQQLGQKLGQSAVDAISKLTEYSRKGKIKFSIHALPKLKAQLSALLLTPTIALATFPGEYFNYFSEHLKSESLVEHTFFVGYSNGSIAYVPTEAATKLGGYGAELGSNVVRVEAGSGQLHTELVVEMISALSK